MKKWDVSTVHLTEEESNSKFLKELHKRLHIPNAQREAKDAECDLLDARLKDNPDLYPYESLLWFLSFEYFDVRAGRKRLSIDEGDLLVIDINKMPSSFASVFCETVDKAMCAGITESVIEQFSGQAHEYLWSKVEDPEKYPKLELIDFPWPVLGIPYDDNDITVEKIQNWLDVFCKSEDKTSRIQVEHQKWDYQFCHLGKLTKRIASGTDKDLIISMVTATTCIFSAFAMVAS